MTRPLRPGTVRRPGHAARHCSRRTFLRGLGLAGLGGGGFCAGLSACSAQGLAPVPVTREVADRSRTDRVVRFGNWLNYIDQAPGHAARHPTLEEFTRRTGITVDYSEPIISNEQFLGLIETELAMGWSTDYDLVVLTDWVVAELIRLGWAHPLSRDLVPNAARLQPHFRDYPVPEVSRYSLPWQGGFTGIVYNMAQTHRPVVSMTDLLVSSDLRGRVSLATEMRDVLTLVMLDMGIDPLTFTSREFGAAVSVLGNAAQAGQFGMVTDYYGPALLKGTIAAAVGWSGDYLNFHQQNPDIRFTWPESGGGLWTDNMVILAGARHADNAERLMNFYYEPAIAAQLSAYQHYVDPVVGAAAAVRESHPALAQEKYVFPTPGLLRSAHFFKLLTPEQNASYTARYQGAVGL